MSLFNSLLDRLFRRGDLLPKEDRSDPYEILDRLRKNHDWIDVQVPKLDKSYQSLILEIDPNNTDWRNYIGCFYLDRNEISNAEKHQVVH